MAQKYPGVTPPIQNNFPTEEQLKSTEDLVETLKQFGLFESEEEAQKREIVLGKLDKMVKEFIYKVCIQKGIPESVASEAGGKIFTFGSYRLGVHVAGADIDTLCVGPKCVTREEFFDVFYSMLKERSEVGELTGVSDAYVPVIKMVFSGIPIDLVYSQLNLPSISDDLDLSDDTLLKNLDDPSIRSLNGSRVTDEILRLVPSIPSFRIALRCIKLWAKNRAIYSNVMGFLGGVAWAMLTARVCQLYPNAAAATVVSKFFRILFQWNWPQPVLLKAIEEGPLQVRVWNPKLYPADRTHRMPIITPAYPSMCATHNVTASTQSIMTAEFKRAADLLDKVTVGSAQWAELFQKHDFFHRYRYYLQVIASSDSSEHQLKWAGMIESRIRQLVMKLELVEHLVLAHPFIKGFDQNSVCNTDTEAMNCAHGTFPKQDEVIASDEKDPGYPKTVYTTTFYIGLCIEPKSEGSNAPRKIDISWPTQEFMKLVKSWDKYDEKSMGIVVQYIKSSGLPNNVFDQGEVRPRTVKRLKSASQPKNVNLKEQPHKKRRGSSIDQSMGSTDDISNTVPSSTTSVSPSPAPSESSKQSTTSQTSSPIPPIPKLVESTGTTKGHSNLVSSVKNATPHSVNGAISENADLVGKRLLPENELLPARSMSPNYFPSSKKPDIKLRLN